MESAETEKPRVVVGVTDSAAEDGNMGSASSCLSIARTMEQQRWQQRRRSEQQLLWHTAMDG